MKRILVLAIVLLNLLSLTEVSAQNYSSETGKTCTGTGIYCSAMNSEADIYTIVFDDSGYEFDDYSEFGDLSQEVVFDDGIRYLYGYGEYNSGNMSTSTVEYGGSGYTNVSNYNTSRLRTQHMVVLTNGDFDVTLRRVTDLLRKRSQQTNTETAAVALESGNYVVYKDKGNQWNSSNVYYDLIDGHPYFLGEMIVNLYHTHPYVNFENKNNPLYVSQADKDVVNHLNLDYIYIVSPEGHLYRVNKDDFSEWSPVY